MQETPLFHKVRVSTSPNIVIYKREKLQKKKVYKKLRNINFFCFILHLKYKIEGERVIIITRKLKLLLLTKEKKKIIYQIYIYFF